MYATAATVHSHMQLIEQYAIDIDYRVSAIRYTIQGPVAYIRCGIYSIIHRCLYSSQSSHTSLNVVRMCITIFISVAIYYVVAIATHAIHFIVYYTILRSYASCMHVISRRFLTVSVTFLCVLMLFFFYLLLSLSLFRCGFQ